MAKKAKVEVDEEEEETGDAASVKIVGDVFTARMQFRDSVELDDAAMVRYTRDGYLVANPRIARTGIQLYHGKECGIEDMDTVRVYRPESEVFSADAVHSYTHLPLTNDHPPEMVTPANWKKYAVGDTGDEPLRDGNAIRVPMMLRDAATIKEYKDGKRELSVGYTCDIARVSGVTDGGEPYDAIQSNVRANHLAVVTAARGGSTLKIGDNQQKETTKMKTVQVDGISCEMSDTAAEVVRKTIDNLNVKLDEFKKKAKKVEEEAEQEETDRKSKDAETVTKLAAKDAEIATLKKQLDDSKVTPAMLDAMSAERTSVIDTASRLLPKDKLVVGGQTADSIRKQVVGAKMGDVAKDWTDAQIAASFAVLAASLPKSGGPLQDAVNAFKAPHAGVPGTPGTMDARDSAYNEMLQRQQDAWKPKAVA